MSGNQNLKIERMKSYFTEAAKEIITEDGTDGISVRRVAEKAGYSYATIYHYYKDLQELLWDVKKGFVLDLQKQLMEDGEGETLNSKMTAYVSYYVEHPNVFRFMYLYPMDCENEHAKELFSLYRGLAETDSKTCIYAIHGLLLLFFSSNGMKKEELYADLLKILDCEGMEDLHVTIR